MILISVTEKGNEIGEKLKLAFPSLSIVSREQVVKEGLQVVTKRAMKTYKTVIFVSSTGIAVRAISPWIEDKTKDPAIIVIDSQAKYVISLLSGHLGGANEITEYIASYLGSMPIITTATDQLGIVAPDIISKNHGLVIESMEKCKAIAVHLIEGEKVAFIDEDKIIPIPKGYVSDNEKIKYKVVVSNKKDINNADLQLIRKNIVLGIGCRKNVDSEKMRNYILGELERENIHALAVKEIVSIDIKKDEKCIIDLAKHLKVPFKIYSKDEINSLDEVFEASNFVQSQIGVKGVCEPCVILSGANIIKGKSKSQGMTLCIGKKEKING